MNVPNHAKVAFKDMTPEERSAIVEAKLRGEVEAFNDAEEVMQWRNAESGYIRLATIYRTRQRKLEIPWEHIKEEYRWAVMNEDEGLWVYVVKPEIYNEEMWDIRGKCSPLPLNINTTGIDWRESLTPRPEGV